MLKEQRRWQIELKVFHRNRVCVVLGFLKLSAVDPSKEDCWQNNLQILTLLRAREIAEELGDVVVLYFIDMAILEARRKNPPTAINYKPRVHKGQKFHERKHNS